MTTFLKEYKDFVLKLQLVGVGGEPQIRRVRLSRIAVGGNVSYDALVGVAVSYTFPKIPLIVDDYDVVLTYYDVDNDCVTIASTEELLDAIEQFKENLVLRVTTDVKRKREIPVPPHSNPEQTSSRAELGEDLKQNPQMQKVVDSFMTTVGSAVAVFQEHVHKGAISALPVNEPVNSKSNLSSEDTVNTSVAPQNTPDPEEKETEEVKEKDAEEKETEEVKEKAFRPFIHGRHTCDRCLCTPIIGLRYHAVNLPDYDLCEQCHDGYDGAEICFESVQLERDVPLQERWHKKRERWANRGQDGPRGKGMPRRHCGSRRHSGRGRAPHNPNNKNIVMARSQLGYTDVDEALCEAIRRSLREVNVAGKGSQLVSPVPSAPTEEPHQEKSAVASVGLIQVKLPNKVPAAAPATSELPASMPATVPVATTKLPLETYVAVPFVTPESPVKTPAAVPVATPESPVKTPAAVPVATPESPVKTPAAVPVATPESPVKTPATVPVAAPELPLKTPATVAAPAAPELPLKTPATVAAPAAPELPLKTPATVAAPAAPELPLKTPATVAAPTAPELTADNDQSNPRTFSEAPTTKQAARPNPQETQIPDEESFSFDAAGNGEVAHELGVTLDECARAINAMMTELDRKNSFASTNDANDSDEEDYMDEKPGGETIVEGHTADEVGQDSEEEGSGGWEVIQKDEQVASDAALARAAQLIGSALFESEVSAQADAPSVLSTSVVSTLSLPSTVPTEGGNVIPGAVLNRWAAHLLQLHDLGFVNDAKNVEILERLYAANIGVDSEEEVTVTQVVNELLSD